MQIMKPLSSATFSAVCYFLPYTLINLPQHPVLTRLQTISFPNKGDRITRQCSIKTDIFSL